MRRRSETGYSTSSGFTAINKPNTNGMGSASESSHKAASIPVTRPDGAQTQEAESPARNPLIAEYLGIGGQAPVSSFVEDTAPGGCMQSGVALGPSAKLVHGLQSPTSQKRKGKACRKPKTGVTRSVSTGMRITKSVNITEDSGIKQDHVISRPRPESSTDKQETDEYKLSEQTTRKLDAFRYNASASTENSVSDSVKGSTPASDCVSVVTPLTSLDALREQQGFGCTVYQGPLQSRHSQASQRTHLTQQQVRWKVSSGERPTSRSNFSCEVDSDGPESHLTSNQSSTGIRPGSALAGGTRCEVDTTSTDSSSFGYQHIRQSTDHSAACDIDDELEDDDFLGILPESSPVDKLGTIHLRQEVALIKNDSRQLPTPQPSDPVLNTSSPQQSCNGQLAPSHEPDDEWMFLDDEVDLTSVDLTSDQIPTSGPVLPASSPERVSEVSMAECFQGGPDQASGSRAVPSIAQSGLEESSGKNWLRPVTRPPFPERTRDRSSIIGLSASMVLRTCFRVGEAINVGCQAVRVGRTVVIELYARVTSSWREQNGVRQHFVFADLFHNRPPYVNGMYELWKGAELWDYDSQRFLDPSDSTKMCRCIGKMKREDHKWKLTILNIWEATWEDIEYVKGVVCA